jgi:heterodisulfide reductase subunit A
MSKEKTEKPRVGVFVCHCGTNIAKTVNCKDLAKFAGKLDDVVLSKNHEFACSEQGQKEIQDAIKKKKLNRVVVASCSPRLHEHTFRHTVSEAGLNPFFFEMANIRENVSWVHHDVPKKATEKAKHIISGAVGRARNLEAIGKKAMSVEQSVLVIGGGVSGIQAALDIAEMDIPVYLVERESSIGGLMAKLVKTFPTGDCSLCILSPKMAEAARNPNIKILSYSEIKDVKGHIGNFEIKIEKKPRYVSEKKCVGCGECSEKCPVEVSSEWDEKMGMRKAIYVPFPQAHPRTFVIDQENCLKFTKNKCGVCQKICPADAVDFKQKPENVNIKVGAIIVATGALEYDPSPVLNYGFSDYEDVITQLQLARMLDPAGPFEGKVIRTSDKKIPKKYLMLQCVGSRDENYNPYCSRICCMSAIKHAMMIKFEQDPDAEIYIVYQDIRSFGKGYEEYYKRACEEGIRFIRSKVAEIVEDEDGSLIARMEDADSDDILEISPDLIVLSSAMVPQKDARELARMLRLDIDTYNFFTERHPKLAPVDSKIQGIYLCGTALGPKDIPDSVAQARAAAVGALRAIFRDSITMDLAKATVEDKLCNSCGICVEVCPYEAVEVVLEEEGVPQGAIVVEAKCNSCGICAAECPTGAMELRHYKKDQMLNQIDGICGVLK